MVEYHSIDAEIDQVTAAIDSINLFDANENIQVDETEPKEIKALNDNLDEHYHLLEKIEMEEKMLKAVINGGDEEVDKQKMELKKLQTEVDGLQEQLLSLNDDKDEKDWNATTSTLEDILFELENEKQILEREQLNLRKILNKASSFKRRYED